MRRRAGSQGSRCSARLCQRRVLADVGLERVARDGGLVSLPTRVSTLARIPAGGAELRGQCRLAPLSNSAPQVAFEAVVSRMHPARLYLMLAPLIYLIYALLAPPFQTPDEHQHLFRAWQVAHFQWIGERRENEAGGLLPAGLGE